MSSELIIFDHEVITYNEEFGSTVTVYQGDYLNVGNILPTDHHYGSCAFSFVCIFLVYSIDNNLAAVGSLYWDTKYG